MDTLCRQGLKFQEENLLSPRIYGGHTSENPARVLDDELEKAGIPFAFCVTHDTVANMSSAVNSAKGKYSIGCIAHLLALAVGLTC